MKNKKVEISKINIKIGDKEIPLSLDEARELRQILNDTFGKEERVFYPSQPIIIERPVVVERPYRPWRWWDITWTSTSGANSAGSGNIVTYTLTSGNSGPDPAPMYVG